MISSIPCVNLNKLFTLFGPCVIYEVKGWVPTSILEVVLDLSCVLSCISEWISITDNNVLLIQY